ncbi:MAG: amidohydrolase family protein [Pseudomonadota bacterium]|nr:amidohydrolase family protein [Pseudomonadota bacterium]
MSSGKRIDVHHHLLPSFLREAQMTADIDVVSYAGFPEWTPEHSSSLMDQLGIEHALFSYSAPGIYFGDENAVIGLSRQCNEYLKTEIQLSPKRFGGFATLPLPNIDAALAEIEYSLDTLNLDGIGLLSNVDGKYAGHAELDPVFSELDRRSAVVFIHPTYPPKGTTKALQIPDPVMEFMFETTRLVGNMIFSGLLERCPNIRFILPHSGGAVPFLAHRMSVFENLPKFKANMPAGAMHYLKSLYFDTTTSGNPIPLGALQGLADSKHILFGTDYPYMKPDRIQLETSFIDGFIGFNEETRPLMERANALSLFPRFSDN